MHENNITELFSRMDNAEKAIEDLQKARIILEVIIEMSFIFIGNLLLRIIESI